MHNAALFFDTYALFEVIRGSPNYKAYQDMIVFTTIFNLAELNYGLKKETDQKTADDFTDKFALSVVAVTVSDVKEAMSLRFRQKDLSIPDAIGYTVAQRLGLKFLTGDEDFKDMAGVEFVKK